MNHRADIEKLAVALGTVSVNAQALAAADLCIGTVTTVRDRLNGWFASISPDYSMRDAAARLTGAIVDVQTDRAEIAGGDAAAPVDGSTWDDLRHAIQRAYDVMWAVQDVQGDQDTGWSGFFSWLGDTVVGSVEAMPTVISRAVGWTGGLLTDTAGGVVSGVLAGFWPVLLLAGGVLAVAVVVLGGGRAAGLVKGALS